jgi:hypothetical protein
LDGQCKCLEIRHPGNDLCVGTSYCSANSFLNELTSNFAMFRACLGRGERNGNEIVIDVPEKCIVLIQDLIGTSIAAGRPRILP